MPVLLRRYFTSTLPLLVRIGSGMSSSSLFPYRVELRDILLYDRGDYFANANVIAVQSQDELSQCKSMRGRFTRVKRFPSLY